MVSFPRTKNSGTAANADRASIGGKMPRISFKLLWFDFWIGWFWNRKSKCLYICPLPCCVICLDFGPKEHDNYNCVYVCKHGVELTYQYWGEDADEKRWL
jgi:hypothetical protein